MFYLVFIAVLFLLVGGYFLLGSLRSANDRLHVVTPYQSSKGGGRYIGGTNSVGVN